MPIARQRICRQRHRIGRTAGAFHPGSLMPRDQREPAAAYRRLPVEGPKTTGKGIALSVVAGLLMGYFYRFVAASMSADFVHLEPGKRHDVAGMTVTTKLQRHGGDSYGFRFEADGRSVVYSTDSEHKLTDPQETASVVDFFRNADVVIFDAMYSLAEATTVKADWGHSSNVVGVELCQLAGARHLCLFHHEPANDDETVAQVLAETRRLEEITRAGQPMQVTAAYDGMEIEL